MIKKITTSLKNINYKIFLALLLLGLIPTIYTTLRVFWLGQLPGEYSYSIAGQLSWINLFFEIANEAIILPLFFFIGKVINDKKELTNRVKTGMLVTFLLYFSVALMIICLVHPLLTWMAVSPDIISESATYIRIEVIASIFSTLVSFALVVLTTMKKEKYLYIFMGIKLFLCVVLDTFLVSTLPISANLGINGIGYSNIISNVLLLFGTIIILNKEDIKIFNRDKLSFSWIKDFFRIGGISGAESFVRNFAYMVMISKMVNIVSEQGTYWVANNFIWGWLLLPIIQLAELIKRDAARDEKAVKNNSLGYFTVTTAVVGLWIVSIPLWKPFMGNILRVGDADKVCNLVLILLGFYVLYAYQNVFDAIFYGLGKTNYMLFESVVTNTIYYGIAFMLYKIGVWIPSLTGIALMFGIGMAFDAVVSLGAYIFLLKKNKTNILKVEKVPVE